MNIPTSLSVSLFLSATLFLTPLAVQATSDFDPNFLISDEEMQDYRSMARADIQAFLDEKGGYISTLKTKDKEGDKRTVSDIIYRASQEHRINPKYLLVKLQKEQSLVTDVDPTQKALDGATGYGITDGCGWSCDSYLRNKGFGKQVDSAAGIIRWYYDNVSSEPWIKKANVTYAIGNTSVRPVNNATAFLYTYTPHIQGNRNFWILWQRWFDQVYPNGTLVKAEGDSTVYLIKNGEKHAFASFAALSTRFDPKLVLTVPASELARYTEAEPIRIPNYSILKRSSTYYLLDFDTVRPFESFDVVRALGYHPDEIIEVDRDDIDHLDKGPTIRVASSDALFGRLVRVKENGNLYYLQDGKLHPMSSEAIASVNFPNLAEEPVSMRDLDSPTIGDPLLFKNGTLILAEGSNKVFVIEDGKKRHISSEAVFVGLGYDWDNIIRVDEYTGIHHKTGQPLYLRAQSNTAPTQLAGQEIVVESPPVVTEQPDYADLMIRTPDTEVSFSGPTFDTDMETYLVANAETGEILAAKNIDYQRPMASLAKVMTAYRLYKEGLSSVKATTYDPADHKALYHRFRIAAGEKILNKDLMDAMLVSSLNTPVRMLVDSVEEDENAFVQRMNEQADTWGLKTTYFSGPSGEQVETVTTAREYLTIFNNATRNRDVKASLSKTEYEYTETLDVDGKPDHFDDHSNDLQNRTDLPYLVLQSKTGYLYESGANLAMKVRRKKDAKEFIIITMGNVDFANRFAEPRRFAQWVMDEL